MLQQAERAKNCLQITPVMEETMTVEQFLRGEASRIEKRLAVSNGSPFYNHCTCYVSQFQLVWLQISKGACYGWISIWCWLEIYKGNSLWSCIMLGSNANDLMCRAFLRMCYVQGKVEQLASQLMDEWRRARQSLLTEAVADAWTLCEICHLWHEGFRLPLCCQMLLLIMPAPCLPKSKSSLPQKKLT